MYFLWSMLNLFHVPHQSTYYADLYGLHVGIVIFFSVFELTFQLQRILSLSV